MHDPVHPVRVFVNEGFDVEGGEWDVPHGIVGVEGVRDVGVPLKADPVAVQVDGLESGVDLQGLGQQPRPSVSHAVTGNVQVLEALVAAQGIDDVVNIVLQLAVREIQLLDCRVLVLEDKTMFLQLLISNSIINQFL